MGDEERRINPVRVRNVIAAAVGVTYAIGSRRMPCGASRCEITS